MKNCLLRIALLAAAVVVSAPAQSVTGQIKVLPTNERPGYWVAAQPGQYVFGAEARAVFVCENERDYPGALLRDGRQWIALRPGKELQEKTFTTESAARRWVQQAR
jgi:hypothetical protein